MESFNLEKAFTKDLLRVLEERGFYVSNLNPTLTHVVHWLAQKGIWIYLTFIKENECTYVRPVIHDKRTDEVVDELPSSESEEEALEAAIKYAVENILT